MERTIATVLPSERAIDDGDMLLWRALPLPGRRALGPFVFDSGIQPPRQPASAFCKAPQ